MVPSALPLFRPLILPPFSFMPSPPMPLLSLSEMVSGQEADLFVLMTAKEQLTTREGKPYFSVAFRDRGREVSFPIWDNSPWAAECQKRWNPGVFYKVRAVYRETNYGPQLDIRKIREVIEADAADGFDPAMCLPQSRHDPRADVRPVAGHRRRADHVAAAAGAGRVDTRGEPRAAAAHPGGPAQPSCLRRRLAGAHAERDANGRLPGGKICPSLSGHEAAAGPRHGGGRGHPPRHRQAPRVGAAAGRRPSTRPRAG